jgi:hypothetical protein
MVLVAFRLKAKFAVLTVKLVEFFCVRAELCGVAPPQ